MSIKTKSILGTLFFLGLSLIYYAFFLYQKDIAIFPNGIAYYTNYSDKDKGGKSEVLKFEAAKSHIEVVFSLENKVGAYAGFNLYLKDSIFKNFNDYNSFKVCLETQNIQSLAFSPRTFEKGVSDSSNLESNRLNYQIINVVQPQKTIYTLPFKDFKIREWWLNFNSHTLQLSKDPDWNATQFISITPEFIKDKSNPASVKVYSIRVSKNNRFYFIVIGGMIGVYWLVFFLFSLPKKQKQIVITHKNLEIPNAPENLSWQEQIEVFIGKEFTKFDLGLNDVARAVDKPSYIVSRHLKSKFNLSFKEYINKIRLEEAKKLLLNSPLSVKEISYAVGFATTNHFTRVFKQEFGVPPSEFRSKI